MRLEPVTSNKPPEEPTQRRQPAVPAEAPKGMLPEMPPVERNTVAMEKELRIAIEQANRVLEIHGRRFNFFIHEPTREIIVQVIDSQTDEVVREIPPEQILDLMAKMLELAGIFVDERR